MSKTKVIETMVSNGLTKAEAERQFEAVFGAVRDTVKRESRVTVPEFGTFEIRRRAERTSQNPRTGEKIRIPERNALCFRASKNFPV